MIDIEKQEQGARSKEQGVRREKNWPHFDRLSVNSDRKTRRKIRHGLTLIDTDFLDADYADCAVWFWARRLKDTKK